MTLSLARRAAHWPDRRALVDVAAEDSSTYGELADAAATAAGRLAAAGVAPGDRVVVLARKSGWLLTLLFGARRRGATLAPVSHRLAPDTVASLVDRLDPALVVCEAAFADRTAAVTARTESVEAFRDREPDPTPGGERDAEPLTLHTGGTTGVPKVVPITERQLEWNAITEATAWGLDDGTVAVTVLPLFHTGGWNLLTLPTLYAGGTVVVPRSFDPGETLSLIETHGATQCFAVAAIYRAMADHPDFEATDFSTVSWFMSGGGPCPESVAAAYRDRGETFVQGYGLTEGGPNNLYHSPERAERAPKPGSVGRPFPDVSVRLVDGDGTVVEGEGTGELEFSGPVTADRYLATEDGTFEGDWVSTGDVARRDDDGDYFVVGRTDNMFVCGGENVHPEAVEAALERHPGVDRVAVTPVPHDAWGRVPKAVVVGDGDAGGGDAEFATGNVDAEALERHAREHLAGYEVPRAWAFVDALPETGAGKLDREALAAEFGE
jgi:fatty-acyl-CoA synthase